MDTPSRTSHTSVGWAGGALVSTAAIAVAAKIAGVIVAPGSRGVLSGRLVNVVETTSGALAYLLTALLVALVCTASFELARPNVAPAARPRVGIIARGVVVAISGLVVALASPAVVERLSTAPSLGLAVMTSLMALIAGVVVLRSPRTRAVGGVLALLALCGLLRVVAWETSAVSMEHDSMRLHDAARGLSTAAVVGEGFAVLLAAAWIGTRSKWRGRVLANVAILAAFGVTWFASRSSDSVGTVELILRQTLPAQIGFPSPFAVGAIAAFLLPASILLAAVALLERDEDPAVITALALALLSHGAFDVPLHALLLTAGAQWAMLAATDARLAQRFGV